MDEADLKIQTWHENEYDNLVQCYKKDDINHGRCIEIMPRSVAFWRYEEGKLNGKSVILFSDGRIHIEEYFNDKRKLQ